MRAAPGLEDAFGLAARCTKGRAIDGDLFLDPGLAHAALKPDRDQVPRQRVGSAFGAQAQGGRMARKQTRAH